MKILCLLNVNIWKNKIKIKIACIINLVNRRRRKENVIRFSIHTKKKKKKIRIFFWKCYFFFVHKNCNSTIVLWLIEQSFFVSKKIYLGQIFIKITLFSYSTLYRKSRIDFFLYCFCFCRKKRTLYLVPLYYFFSLTFKIDWKGHTATI